MYNNKNVQIRIQKKMTALLSLDVFYFLCFSGFKDTDDAFKWMNK